MQIPIYEGVLKAQHHLATENQKLFKKFNVFVVGLMGSPGAGKTSILEKTIPALQKIGKKTAVLVGDIATTRDAERVSKFNIPCAQLTTGGACHLEAQIIAKAVQDFDLSGIDFLFIENVGNLVCPASYPLGEHIRAIVLSVTEGDDKVEKYPATFQKAQCVIMNKMDFLHMQPYNQSKVIDELISLNKDINIFNTSCANGDGIDKWVTFLLELKKNGAA